MIDGHTCITDDGGTAGRVCRACASERAAREGWEFYCEHANEVPQICPCPRTCGCRQHGCKGKGVLVNPLREAAEQAKRALKVLFDAVDAHEAASSSDRRPAAVAAQRRPVGGDTRKSHVSKSVRHTARSRRRMAGGIRTRASSSKKR